MAEKLYKFLIVDEAKLRESDCFEYYSAKEIYIKLRNKYESMLAVLEYLQGIQQMQHGVTGIAGRLQKQNMHRKHGNRIR